MAKNATMILNGEDEADVGNGGKRRRRGGYSEGENDEWRNEEGGVRLQPTVT